MPKCTECEHCFLNDVWGDYRCRARQITIYSMEKYADCEDFKEKKNENPSNNHDGK